MGLPLPGPRASPEGWDVRGLVGRLARSRTRPAGSPGPRRRKPSKFNDRWDAQVAALEAFVSWINHPAQADVVARIRRELRGRDLACYCSEHSPCHADVLLLVANQDPPAEVPMPTFARPAARPAPRPASPRRSRER